MNQLLLISKEGGIVNVYNIKDEHKNLIQLIHTGTISFTIKLLNPYHSDPQIINPVCRHHIKDYMGIYLNGIKLVHNGHLVDAPWWTKIFN